MRNFFLVIRRNTVTGIYFSGVVHKSRLSEGMTTLVAAAKFCAYKLVLVYGSSVCASNRWIRSKMCRPMIEMQTRSNRMHI